LIVLHDLYNARPYGFFKSAKLAMRRVEVREGKSVHAPSLPCFSLARARSSFALLCLLACIPFGSQFTSFTSTTVQIRTPQKPSSPLPNLEFVHKHTLPHTHTHTHPHNTREHVLWPVDISPYGLGSLAVTSHWSHHGIVIPTGHTQNNPKKITNPSPC
jgi:hypothetical protein